MTFCKTGPNVEIRILLGHAKKFGWKNACKQPNPRKLYESQFMRNITRTLHWSPQTRLFPYIRNLEPHIILSLMIGMCPRTVRYHWFLLIQLGLCFPTSVKCHFGWRSSLSRRLLQVANELSDLSQLNLMLYNEKKWLTSAQCGTTH